MKEEELKKLSAPEIDSSGLYVYLRGTDPIEYMVDDEE